jgi:hypothetical protein
MPDTVNRSLAILSACTLISIGAQAAPAAAQPSAATTLPPCPIVHATLAGPLDSATANLGDRITFTTIASNDGADALPAGLTGYGIVDYVQHARRARGGELSIEARYVVRADGTKVPVTSVSAYAVTKGSSRDVPGVAGVIGIFKGTVPEVISGTLGAYGFLHYGAEAVIPAAAQIELVVGDGIADGTCSIAPLLGTKSNYRVPQP